MSFTTSAQRPGELDTSFNGNGFVNTSITPNTDQASDLIIQPDGKIVVVGDTRNGSNSDFVVVRYNANGTLDTKFDGDGIVTTAIGVGNEEARAVALQPDGKIVVVGYSDNAFGSSDFAVIRYNSDGSVDMTFNGSGKITTPIGSLSDYAESVALQDDGKIVVAGRFLAGANSNEDTAVVRYNPDGTLDATFSGDGKQTTATGLGKETVGAVLLQPDGKIIVAGSANTSAASNFEFYDFAAVRYHSNGTLDMSFDFDGIVTTEVGTLADFGRDAKLQPDGKIVVTGLTASRLDYGFGTVRYNSDGSLDSLFGNGGKVVTNFGSYESANSLLIQTDGKIVVAGGNSSFTLIRYLADGFLDHSFYGSNGEVTMPSGSARAAALQSDGKIVVAGISPYNGTFNIRVARYRGNSATAPSATIRGRVVSPAGRGLPRAVVRLTEKSGDTRTVIANSSGYYSFRNIRIGQIVMIKAISKQYQFQTQSVPINSDITNLVLQGLKQNKCKRCRMLQPL